MTMPEPELAPVDRCPRCWCGGCNGLLAEHTRDGCQCEECTACPEYACAGFVVSERITLLFQQLSPLLSSHLHERAARRCMAVAHAAHHAIHDYDYPEDAKQEQQVDAVARRAVAVITGMGADLRQARADRDRYRVAYRSARQRAATASGALDGVESNLTAVRAERDQLQRQVDELNAELSGWEIYNDSPPPRAVDSTPDISTYEEQIR